jgi:hypothetical protein
MAKKKRGRMPGTPGQKVSVDGLVDSDVSGPVYAYNIHEQVTIQQEGRTAEVDEGIAALVVALWRRGFDTVSSCQSFPPAAGLAYIAFPDRRQAEVFCRAVGKEAEMSEVTEEDVAEAAANGHVEIAAGTFAVAFPPSRIPALEKAMRTKGGK